MNRNRNKSHLLMIIASIGLAALAAGLVISLPAVIASNAPVEQKPVLTSHEKPIISRSSLENNSPRQTGLIPDSTLTETVELPPISTQNGILPPDMVASENNELNNPQIVSIAAQNGQSSGAASPTQIEAGEFIGINGAVCAYNNFTDTLAAAVNGDVIYIRQGAWVGRIGEVNKNVTFAAANNDCTQLAAGGVTIDANDELATLGGVIQVGAYKNVTLSYLTLTNGAAISGGIAAVNTGANLVLDHSHISNGYAYNGGGIFMNGGSLTLNESSVFSNTAQIYGGGIFAVYGPNITIQDNSQVASNLVTDFNGMGGGIYIRNNDGYITVTNSTILSNTASYAGGIRMMGDNQLWLQDQAELKYNRSIDGWGGALLSSGGTLNIEDVILEHNTTGAEGGAIWAGECTVSISNTVIYSNTSGNYGGGVFVGDDSTVNIVNSQILDNEAFYWGGGVFVAANAILNVEENSHIDENSTGDTSGIGGGMYISGDNSQITITASTVMSNIAQLSGSGIRLNGASTLKLVDETQVSANSTLGAGGGLAASLGTVEINGASFMTNSANGNGGAIWLDSGDLTMIDSNLTDNDCRDSGGGIFRSGGNLALYAISQTTEISDNDATTEGGGIFDESGLDLTIEAINGWQYLIKGNTAIYGAGAYFAHATTLHGSGDIDFLENIADISGGGIFAEDNASIYLVASSSSAAPDFLANQASNDDGGAIYAINNTDVTLSGSTLGSPTNGNTALNGSGGAIFMESGYIDLTNVTFNNNQAKGNGGAMALYTSTLSMQSAFPVSPVSSQGIEESSGVLVACDPIQLPTDQYCSQFSSNTTSTGDGGAVFLENSTATIAHTAFLDNAADSGGALYISLSSLELSQARVTDNESYSYVDPAIISVDGGSGGGVNAYLTATNTTIVDNLGTAINYAHYTSGVFDNNIVWGNETRGVILPYATASCNNTQNRSLGGDNISQYPQFTETSRGKYHLAYFSPSADVCSGAAAFDLDGFPRPQGAAYDMGAFEAIPPTALLPIILR